MAWNEGKSDRHPADIFEMMVFHYLGGDAELDFDGDYVSERASRISERAVDLWNQIDTAAKEEAARS
jgi:hypothetical protein